MKQNLIKEKLKHQQKLIQDTKNELEDEQNMNQRIISLIIQFRQRYFPKEDINVLKQDINFTLDCHTKSFDNRSNLEKSTNEEAQLTILEYLIEKTTVKLGEKQRIVNEQQNQLQKMKGQLHNHKRLIPEMEQLKGNLVQKELAFNQLQNSIKSTYIDIQNLHNENKVLRERLEESQQNHDQILQKNIDSTNQLGQLKDHYQEVESQVACLREENQQHKADEEKLQNEILGNKEAAEIKIKQLEKDLETNYQNFCANLKELQNLQKDHQNLIASHKDNEKKVSDLKKECEKIPKLESENNSIKNEKNNLVLKMAELEQECQSKLDALMCSQCQNKASVTNFNSPDSHRNTGFACNRNHSKNQLISPDRSSNNQKNSQKNIHDDCCFSNSIQKNQSNHYETPNQIKPLDQSVSPNAPTANNQRMTLNEYKKNFLVNEFQPKNNDDDENYSQLKNTIQKVPEYDESGGDDRKNKSIENLSIVNLSNNTQLHNEQRVPELGDQVLGKRPQDVPKKEQFSYSQYLSHKQEQNEQKQMNSIGIINQAVKKVQEQDNPNPEISENQPQELQRSVDKSINPIDQSDTNNKEQKPVVNDPNPSSLQQTQSNINNIDQNISLKPQETSQQKDPKEVTKLSEKQKSEQNIINQKDVNNNLKIEDDGLKNPNQIVVVDSAPKEEEKAAIPIEKGNQSSQSLLSSDKLIQGLNNKVDQQEDPKTEKQKSIEKIVTSPLTSNHDDKISKTVQIKVHNKQFEELSRRKSVSNLDQQPSADTKHKEIDPNQAVEKENLASSQENLLPNSIKEPGIQINQGQSQQSDHLQINADGQVKDQQN